MLLNVPAAMATPVLDALRWDAAEPHESRLWPSIPEEQRERCLEFDRTDSVAIACRAWAATALDAATLTPQGGLVLDLPDDDSHYRFFNDMCHTHAEQASGRTAAEGAERLAAMSEEATWLQLAVEYYARTMPVEAVAA